MNEKFEHLRAQLRDRLGGTDELMRRLDVVTGRRSHFEDVREFHRKLNLPVAETPRLLSDAEINLRVDMFLEEIIEFTRAQRRGDVVDAFDALVDLAYFVVGTAVQMGLPWDEGWDAVHAANMTKEAVPAGKDSKVRAAPSGFDVVKPDGWVGPEAYLENLVKKAGDA